MIHKSLSLRTFFIAFFLMTAFLHADVHVKVSRTSIKFNESLQVSFKTDEKVSHQPDFSPLETDFTILSTQQSSSTRMVNGVFSQEYGWNLTLAPKREGTLTIAPIKIDNQISRPVSIEVSEATQPAKGDPLYIDASISPNSEVYEGAQLLLTVRLFCAVNLMQGIIHEPTISDNNAIVEKLGPDSEYDKLEGNTHYHVIERIYAIFPEQAGELKISPILFEGQVVTRGRSIFDMQTQIERLAAQPLTIDVRPIPAPYNKLNWLPAEEVTIEEEWSSDPAKLSVGEAITRTITIKTKGALATQIPTPDLKIPEEFKQYPDKPTTNNHKSDEGILGIKQIKMALIPSKAGDYTFPEVQVNWWNTKTKTASQAKVAARKVIIADAAIALASPLPQQVDRPFISAPPTETIPLWAWGLLAINGFGLLGYVGIKVFNKIKPWFKPRATSPKKRFKNACFSNNPKEAEKALLTWADAASLAELKEKYPSEIQDLLEELNGILYGSKPHNAWDGTLLWKAISKSSSQKTCKKDEKHHPLPSLY